MLLSYQKQWFGHVRKDILAGLVVGLALIPEAISFSVIAGVDPSVGLYAAFSMAVVIAFVGGRPAMISAATGAMALLMVTLVKEHGLQYLFATTILTGLLQITIGKIRLARLMRFVPKPVVIGFVNALAIVTFMAQLPHLIHVPYAVYGLVVLGLLIIYAFPKIPKVGQMLPPSLVCIIVLTLLTIFLGLSVKTVGDMGHLPQSLPVFLMPDIPFTWQTLGIIFPYAIAMAFVGLLESVMTAKLIDQITHTESNKHQECIGQGIANIVTGFLGGMAGCAIIGQSMINVKSGARGRLSTFVAGAFLLVLVLFLTGWLKVIPMAALVAVMIVVCIHTFDWQSITQFKNQPTSNNVVMIVTVAVVLLSHNLALGVLAGVLVSALCLVAQLEQSIQVKALPILEQTQTYQVTGQLFFSSSDIFLKAFDFNIEAVHHVVIDLTAADVWDINAVEALDLVAQQYQYRQITCTVVGLNERSLMMMQRYGRDNTLVESHG
ncbi:SulP family inorganic anion transporter [Acinetobacter rathckeae]|uniref:SulP family inorganic anion transporter n=1 Tax=Acinetobacter rathckeae TaxID=2605272 RepID=UPI0018A26365|nr:SulP family inorganic anion transporter [Acinetobacter rathckeae]MBF7688133.1 SulP family inorganic anion transporter [Acinetobacter rathckeae]MBF7695356.1 SulP family inorganic anion transporter [Acinetobacter rathckeae]